MKSTVNQKLWLSTPPWALLSFESVLLENAYVYSSTHLSFSEVIFARPVTRSSTFSLSEFANQLKYHKIKMSTPRDIRGARLFSSGLSLL